MIALLLIVNPYTVHLPVYCVPSSQLQQTFNFCCPSYFLPVGNTSLLVTNTAAAADQHVATLMTCGVSRLHVEKGRIWWDSSCFCFVSCLSSPGMPAAYDLSTVIGSGTSVSHNNLIPLGTNHTPPGPSTSCGTWSSGEQIGEQQRKSAVQHEVPGMHENN